jgi:hypothetical protein
LERLVFMPGRLIVFAHLYLLNEHLFVVYADTHSFTHWSESISVNQRKRILRWCYRADVIPSHDRKDYRFHCSIACSFKSYHNL